MAQGKQMTGDGDGTLVVLLHAFDKTPEALASVQDTVRTAWPRATVFCPDFKLTFGTFVDANTIVAKVLRQVDTEVNAAQASSSPVRDIVFVGHSFGALLARKLYVVACGETQEAPFEETLRQELGGAKPMPPLPWADRVSRLVLLAGMNRGWRITSHLGLGRALFYLVGVFWANLLYYVLARLPTIMSIRQGAPFITQLRIQWIRMRRQRQARGEPLALTVQLLGSRDDLVAPDDNVDLVSGGDFVYLDVPYSGHADVIDFADKVHGAARRAVFVDALTASAETLQRDSVLPADEGIAADEKVRHVAFVIHGIRDAGYWTHKIARRIRVRAGAARDQWATETSSYGYFPMLPFMFSWRRRHKVEWLMDQYTEALARYPNAKFSYVGHSNGTYLVAKAMELYPCCSFENIVFAGSVVRRKYDWTGMLRQERVKNVLNFVATRDLVVAAFPNLFEFIGLQDLGSAGHNGFSVDETTTGVTQVNFVRGGHSAAIEEPVWDVIADFVLHGKVDRAHFAHLPNTRSRLATVIGAFPPLAWLAILGALYGFWLLTLGIIQMLAPSSFEFWKVHVAAAYVLVAWLVLTRV